MNKIIFYSILLTFLLSSSKSLGGSSSKGPIIFNATQSDDVTIVEFSVSNSSLEYPVKGEIQWSDDFKNPNATINQIKLSSTDLKKNQTKLPEILIDGTLLRLWVEYSNGSSETSVEFKFDCSSSQMNCSVNGSVAKSLFGKKDDNNDVVIIVVIFIAAVTCLVLYVIYANSNSSSSRISTKQLGFDRRRTRRPLLIDNDDDTNNPISV